MKLLDVPTTSITEVKKNPTEIFNKARKKTGVYVFNRNDVSGVMLTHDQYHHLIKRIDTLEEQLLDYEVEKRLNENNLKSYSDEEVRGELANRDIQIDEGDGWE